MTIYIYSIVTWYYIFFYRFLLTVRIVQDSHLPLKIAGPRRGAQTQGWHGAEAAGVAEDGHGRQRCLAESHKGRWEKNHSCRILWFNDVNIAHIYIYTYTYIYIAIVVGVVSHLLKVITIVIPITTNVYVHLKTKDEPHVQKLKFTSYLNSVDCS